MPVDRTVTDGDRVPVGATSLEVIHLAGHTPVASPCCTTPTAS